MVTIRDIAGIITAGVLAYIGLLRLFTALIVPSKESLEIQTSAMVLNATGHSEGGVILKAHGIYSGATSTAGIIGLTVLVKFALPIIGLLIILIYAGVLRVR